jgi:sarcosine oxidase subunit alpha
MSGDFRTAAGGRIDRARRISFTFDGVGYEGAGGDTLASALIANGVHLLGRSFKYHRPRGLLSVGIDEPNSLVSVDAGGGRVTPNLRAPQVELYDGLVARSQNAWPSLRFDIGAINGALSPLFPAGFYYKTFIGPPGAWESLYEPFIRRAAGLGVAPSAPDPDSYAFAYRHCDVAVIGSGPAGLAAALAAARAGDRVILFDEQPEFGGSLLGETKAVIDGLPVEGWRTKALDELAATKTVTLLKRTQVFGYYLQNFLAAAERLTDHRPGAGGPRERLWQVRAKRVVLATGAHERPLVFPDNDRPGVVLAEAARLLAARYGALAGVRIVVTTSHDSAYRAALELKAAGAQIAAIADLRAQASGPWPEAARAAGLPVETGAAIVGTRGGQRVTHALISRSGAAAREIECDLVAMSGGFTPSVHLFSQSRGKLKFDSASQTFLPGASAQAQTSAGACNGAFSLAAALAEGFFAGGGLGEPPRAEEAPDMGGGSVGLVAPLPEKELAKAFVDFQNDVTARDIRLATREGLRSIEHIKRYTTTGMATDQGKSSNLNALAIAADALRKPIEEVGLTTFRLPYTPVSFGLIGGPNRGRLFDPVRRTPIHAWYEGQGAVWEEAGLWKRASRIPKPGESRDDTIRREILTTRGAAGIMDASTLGKIEVVGADAAEFLNRLYINGFSKLGVGRCRYGLMLNEQGFVYDDGVVMRLSDDRFHITTTTGGAAHVWSVMEDYRQTEWPDLKVHFTSISEQFATIAINGPQARAILDPLVEGIDLSSAAFPHMSVRVGRICGVPTRLARVSFTGELGFEVNVPTDYGAGVQEAIWAEASKRGACAYGLDSLLVMRAEKGFIVVGQETDGTVTADDLGFGRMIQMSKPDFIGKRSLSLPELRRPGRKQLVGLLPEDAGFVIDEGAQIVAEPAPKAGTPALGHVTSSYMSPTLQRGFAMALIADGRAKIGATLYATGLEGSRPARIVEPVFYDREGARLEA